MDIRRHHSAHTETVCSRCVGYQWERPRANLGASAPAHCRGQTEPFDWGVGLGVEFLSSHPHHRFPRPFDWEII